jgi:hypothetical protein
MAGFPEWKHVKNETSITVPAYLGTENFIRDTSTKWT